jgi:hypothetical protein
MGHTRLGELPATRNWRQVVGLLDGGAGTGEIALVCWMAVDVPQP